MQKGIARSTKSSPRWLSACQMLFDSLHEGKVRQDDTIGLLRQLLDKTVH